MSRHSPGRHGTTLIEVLLGLLLLATLLSSAVIARGRFMRGCADAQRKMQLLTGADQLLSQWMSSAPSNLAFPSDGTLPNDSTMRWRAEVIPDMSAQALHTFKVRLTVQDVKVSTAAVSIDVLFHDPHANTQPAAAP